MGDKRLYLIDATAFCYRAFYALRTLATSFGLPTNAVYGFVAILNKILKENKPEYLAVCFDVSRATFRQKKFTEYKIQRPPMPQGLSEQIPLIKKIISGYGISLFEKEGFEADDIIATITEKASKAGLSVTIVSSDKDILQLVDENILVFSPYKDEGIIYDRKKVLQRFGVEPERIIDLIALMGDAVDNIPGVPGIGEKTAQGLIQDFGSLEGLLENLDKLKSEKTKRIIKDNIEKINLSRELAILDRNVAIDLDLERLKLGQPDYKELFSLFKHLEFKRFLKDLPQEETKPQADTLVSLRQRELEGLFNQDSQLFLFGLEAQDLVFSAQGKLFHTNKIGKSLKNILASPAIKKISHDLKKVKVSLSRLNIALAGLYFDTKIAAYLLNPSKPGYELIEVSWDYLGASTGARITSNQEALGLILKLTPRLESELREKSLFKLFCDLEMPLVEVLAQIELNGIKLDLEALSELSLDIEKRLIKLIEAIYNESGVQFNINSPKQLREILFVKLQLPVLKRSKTGPSTDEEVLSNLSSRHKLPALLLEYRQLTKLKNTYIDTLPNLVDKATGRVHTSFNQTGTETGRLSSSNPNLQNIPIKTDIGRKIRQAIVSSSAGHLLLSSDYSQIELRLLAHLSGDERLNQAFRNDKDIHKATAALIYGLDENEVTDQMREVAKRVNFGIVYGLTAYGLSRDLGIAVEEASAFIEAYFLRYPKVKSYIQEQIKKAESDGFVTTILGRRRYLPQINNKNQAIRQFAQRQAVNTPIQGSASDLIKLAMVAIHRQISQRNLSAKMILQVHDELVFDLPAEELEDLAGLVKDRMEKVLQLSVPIKVDMKKGKNWLEMEEI